MEKCTRFQIFLNLDNNNREGCFLSTTNLAFYILFHIWYTTNKICFECLVSNVHDIIQQALFDRNIWHQATSKLNVSIENITCLHENWLSPPPSCIKIIFGANF